VKQLIAMGTVVLPVPHRLPLDARSAAIFFALGIFALLVARRRPVYAIALLVLLDPFDGARYVLGTTITLPKVALLGALLGLALRRPSFEVLRAPRSRPLVAGMLAILAATLLTAIPGVYIDAVARETLKTLEYAAAFAFAALAFTADRDERVIWRAIEIATASVALLALAQLFTVAPSGIVLDGHVVPRIAGPLEGPNQLAGYFDLAIPLLLARTLWAGDRWALLVLSLAAVADVLTLSRSGVLAALVGCVAVLAIAGRLRLRSAALLPAAGAVLLVAGLLAMAGLLPRFLSVEEVGRENGLATRGELWRAALALWIRHPLLGVGAGNYELMLPTVGLIGVRTHANSAYLQALAEGGIPLLLATVWTAVAAVRSLWPRGNGAPLLTGIAAASLALGLHQLFDCLTFFPKIGTYWWLLLGMGIAALPKETLISERR
jgi:O-antigen ligase